MKKRFIRMCLLCLPLILGGCAGAPLVSALREQNIYVVGEMISMMNFLVGAGIAWYCWSQAKEKNRNPWIWSIGGGIFGLFALVILVYLKKAPKKISTV